MARFDGSLYRRFLILCAGVFLIGGVAGYRYFVWYTDDIVHVLGQRLVERNALYEKSKLLSLVAREVTLTQKMASSPVLKRWVADEGNSQRRSQALTELEDYRDFFRSRSYFVAHAASGNYYYNDAESQRTLAELAQPKYTLDSRNLKDGWFYATLRKVKDLQLNVDTDRHLGLTRVWINTVVRNDEQRAVAVAGTGIDLSEFIQAVVRKRDGGSNLLIDEHGAIQAHQNVSMIDFASARKIETSESQHTLAGLIGDQAQVAALEAALQDVRSGKVEAYSLALNVQGGDYLAGIAWIPEIRWFVISLVNPAEVSGAARLPVVILTLSIALAAVLLLAWVFVQRTVLRRLNRLDRATQQMAAGDYGLDLNDHSPDEIGRLARAFSGMAGKVASYTDDLRRQVAERTAELVAMANTDALTGLLNRRGMSERLQAEMNRLRREGRAFGLLQIDLDHFKQINDSFGHAAGDDLLVAVADVVRQNTRDYDACARWGGEEFLVALFDAGHIDDINAVAEKLCAATRDAHFVWEDQPVRITCSIGAAAVLPGADIDAVLRHVDRACYAAKTAGRDRVVFSCESAELAPEAVPVLDAD